MELETGNYYVINNTKRVLYWNGEEWMKCIKDRQGGRMSRFGNDKIEFSIVGGSSGLYGNFEDTEYSCNKQTQKFFFKNNNTNEQWILIYDPLEMINSTLIQAQHSILGLGEMNFFSFSGNSKIIS